MPSIGDIFDQLKDINTNLQNVQAELNHIDAGLSGGFNGVLHNLQTLIVEGDYTNQALSHIAQQEDTVICILEHVSKNTCAILNEVHTQTSMQLSLMQSAAALLALYRIVNSPAAIEFDNLEKVRQEVLACCPPPEPKPVCQYEPCSGPESTLGNPPAVDQLVE
jgi:hypothetical protein